METIPAGWGWLGSDDGNSDYRANSVQLELELGLSLAKLEGDIKYHITWILSYTRFIIALYIIKKENKHENKEWFKIYPHSMMKY